MVEDYDLPTEYLYSTLNWAKNIITHQQGIILEPYYNKVQDFAMEFYIEGEVNIVACLFPVFTWGVYR